MFLVSLVCFLTIGFLMVSNLVEYLDNTPTEELFVDTSRNKKLQINFDIIVPKIPCDCMYLILFTFMVIFLKLKKYMFIDLALDTVDSSGETHLQVDQDIFKRRLNLTGHPISDPEKTNGKFLYLYKLRILLMIKPS